MSSKTKSTPKSAPKSAPKPKQEKQQFTKETRPVPSKILAKKMTTWFALRCHPESFDTELCSSILSRYWFQTRKLKKDAEDAFSNKQYDILYNIYTKFKVDNIFSWDELPMVCCDVSDFGEAQIVSDSGLICENYYFETKDRVKYELNEFVEKFGGYIKHTNYITELSQLNDDDFD